jgi:hypothetical protein
MSNDRELLDLAAKAAGFGAPDSGAVCWTESEYPRRSGKHGALWNYVGHMDTAELWNPLTDDGDALRLAAKLGMATATDYPSFGEDGRAAATCPTRSGLDSRSVAEYFDDETEACTALRRAIVRAAAEIGKAMP